jgi:hypothetical protein
MLSSTSVKIRTAVATAVASAGMREWRELALVLLTYRTVYVSDTPLTP